MSKYEFTYPPVSQWPSWANYAARDYNGERCYSVTRPRPEQSKWVIEYGARAQGISEGSGNVENWRDSLVTREEQERRDAEQLQDSCSSIDDIVSRVVAELHCATEKFPDWPTDILHALAIVNEEVGELQKEVLQAVYERHKTAPGSEKIRVEATQAAAMLLRFLLSFEKYEYPPSEWHSQN